MQVESVSRDAIELLQATLGKAPEAFDAINISRASDELIRAMIDSEVFRVSDINQAVIAAPAIRVDHSFSRHSTANNGLQRGLFAVRHNLRIDAAVTFEDAEDNGFARSPAPALASDAMSTKVAFINFDFARHVSSQGTINQRPATF